MRSLLTMAIELKVSMKFENRIGMAIGVHKQGVWKELEANRTDITSKSRRVTTISSSTVQPPNSGELATLSSGFAMILL